MRAFNLGAVRRALYASAVLTLLSVPSLAQVVERGRTFADLTASHPCDTGLTNRIARVTDCDAADDIGDGEGAFQCWAICDGSAPWVAQAIGGGAGGAGVSGLDTADGGTALADNTIVRGDGTTGIQGSAVTIADTTGDLQWEGTTADAFEGNFTFADPTADWTWAWGADGTLTGPNLVVSGKTVVFGDPASNADTRLAAASNIFRVKTGDDLYYQTLGAGSMTSYRYDASAYVQVNGDLQSIIPSTGNLEVSGSLDIADPGTRPTCDSSKRGRFFVDEGGAGVADTVAVCTKDAADSYAWHDLY